MRHLKLGVLALIPLSLISCAGILNQTGIKPVQREYFIPAVIEQVDYTRTDRTRKIPVKECINGNCRRIGVVEEYEVLVTYHLVTQSYNQHLIYQRYEGVATANPTKSNQRVIAKVTQYEDGTSEVTRMELLP